MAEMEKPLTRFEREDREREKEEKKREKYEKERAKWKKKLKPYETVVDYFLEQARDTAGIYGDVLVSPALLDQIVTLNPVTLEGQAEIIYNIFIYRVAKWHYNVEKADEYIKVTPTAPPAFAPLVSQKERLEGHVKSGLASAAQAVADYELMKHDERKYREILDYFKMGKKDEHVLRALYVDRVDAYTGEGYSMVTMAKRWPTIISDFIKMKSAWMEVDTIKGKLKVSKAEAVVLKTKNELFVEWKRLFFPDVRDRYVRIKNLLESRKRSIHEYREWLKPHLNKLKRIREQSEIEDAASDLTEITKLMFTPQGEVEAKLWFWKPIRPEEMGKPVIVSGWGEVPMFDDWVKENIMLLEAKYDVEFTEEEFETWMKAWKGGGRLYAKRRELLAVHPGPAIDERFNYYFFIDLDYVCQYKKGSTGPMVIEDQYWHFNPFLVSKNFMLLALLELEFKKKRLREEIERLIGVTTEEEKIGEEVKREWPREGDKEEKEKARERWKKSWSRTKAGWVRRRRKLKNVFKPLLKFFVRPGPYEINVAERVSKTYGIYFGGQVAELRDLIKETSYRISGQRP
ncbi:MAG: hypothetical protein V3U72_05210 [Candidatus Aenigmarchaeota archaeon]